MKFKGALVAAGIVAAMLLPALPAQAAATYCYGYRATKVGTTGPDVINGTGSRDVIQAKAGNDQIAGNGGNDRICGSGKLLRGRGCGQGRSARCMISVLFSVILQKTP